MQMVVLEKIWYSENNDSPRRLMKIVTTDN